MGNKWQRRLVRQRIGEQVPINQIARNGENMNLKTSCEDQSKQEMYFLQLIGQRDSKHQLQKSYFNSCDRGPAFSDVYYQHLKEFRHQNRCRKRKIKYHRSTLYQETDALRLDSWTVSSGSTMGSKYCNMRQNLQCRSTFVSNDCEHPYALESRNKYSRFYQHPATQLKYLWTLQENSIFLEMSNRPTWNEFICINPRQSTFMNPIKVSLVQPRLSSPESWTKQINRCLQLLHQRLVHKESFTKYKDTNAGNFCRHTDAITAKLNAGPAKYVSAISQTLITTVSGAFVAWEYSDDSGEWKMMAPSYSLAIENSMAVGSESAVREAAQLVSAHYEFDFDRMTQTNLVTGRVRRIRRSAAQLDAWEATLDANGQIKCELEHALEREKKKSLELASCQRDLTMSNISRTVLQKAADSDRNELCGLRHRLKTQEGEHLLLKEQLATLEQNLTNALCREHTIQAAKEAACREAGSLLERMAKETQEKETLRRQASDMVTKLKDSGEALAAAEKSAASDRELTASYAKALQESEKQVTKLVSQAEKAEAALQASASQLVFADFQLTVQLLLRGSTPAPDGTERIRVRCDTAQFGSCLRGFGVWVERAFLETRAAHRQSYRSQELCEVPVLCVSQVDAVVNVEAAERFRHFVQQAQAHYPPSSGCQQSPSFTASALRTAPAVMQIKGLEEGVGQLVLGWHGASDEAIEDIVRDGFNPFSAGSGAGSLFGRGIYLAENSSKADLYAGPAERRFKRFHGQASVILAAAFTGKD